MPVFWYKKYLYYKFSIIIKWQKTSFTVHTLMFDSITAKH